MIELHDLPAGLRVGGRGALPQPGLSAWPGNRYDLPVKTSNGGMGMETVGIVSTDDLGEAEPAREGGTAPVVLQPGEKRLVYLCAMKQSTLFSKI